MVHVWGPIISPTKLTPDDSKRVSAPRPPLSAHNVWRLPSGIQAAPIYYLKRLTARTGQCAKSLFKWLMTLGLRGLRTKSLLAATKLAGNRRS